MATHQQRQQSPNSSSPNSNSSISFSKVNSTVNFGLLENIFNSIKFLLFSMPGQLICKFKCIFWQLVTVCTNLWQLVTACDTLLWKAVIYCRWLQKLKIEFLIFFLGKPEVGPGFASRHFRSYTNFSQWSRVRNFGISKILS